MIKIFKKISEVLEKKTDEFTEVFSVDQDYEMAVSIRYAARNPKRETTVEFDNEEKAIKFLETL